MVALALAVGCGVCVATQGKVNGELNAAGAGALMASWICLLGTAAGMVTVVAVRRQVRTTFRTLRREASWWWFAVGLGIVPAEVSIAAGVPVLGVAITSVCLVAGQTVSSLALDAAGIGVPVRLRPTGRRLLSGLVAIGSLGPAVVLGRSEAAGGTVITLLLGGVIFVSGLLLAGQLAGTGRAVGISQDASTAALAAVFGALSGMTGVILIAALCGGLEQVVLPDPLRNWSVYLGGPIGVAISIVGAWAVRHLGTFTLTLAILAGQMLTALAIDLAARVIVGWPTFAAAAMVLAATALAGATSGRHGTTAPTKSA